MWFFFSLHLWPPIRCCIAKVFIPKFELAAWISWGRTERPMKRYVSPESCRTTKSHKLTWMLKWLYFKTCCVFSSWCFYFSCSLLKVTLKTTCWSFRTLRYNTVHCLFICLVNPLYCCMSLVYVDVHTDLEIKSFQWYFLFFSNG